MSVRTIKDPKQLKLYNETANKDLDAYEFKHFPNKSRINIKKILTTKHEHPNEFFDYSPPKSTSPTVNLCNGIINKTNILHDRFRGTAVPRYLKNAAQNDPKLAEKYNSGSSPASAYNFRQASPGMDDEESLFRQKKKLKRQPQKLL